MQTREEQQSSSEPFSAAYKYRESPVYSANIVSARVDARDGYMTYMAYNLMESFASLTEEIHAIRSPVASFSGSRLGVAGEPSIWSALSLLLTSFDFASLPLAAVRLDACVCRLEARTAELKRLSQSGEAPRQPDSDAEIFEQMEKRVCGYISALEGRDFNGFDVYIRFLREKKAAEPKSLRYDAEALKTANGELAFSILKSQYMLRADSMLQEIAGFKAHLKTLKEQQELTDRLLSERLSGLYAELYASFLQHSATLRQENAILVYRIAEMATKARTDEQIIMLLRAELQTYDKKHEMLLQHSQVMQDEVQKAENERVQRLKSQVSEMQHNLAQEQQTHEKELQAMGETMRQQRQFNEQCSRIIQLQQSQLRGSAASRTLSLTTSFYSPTAEAQWADRHQDPAQVYDYRESLRLEDM